MTRKAVGRIGITVALLLGAASWVVAAQRPSSASSKTVSNPTCVEKKTSDGKTYFDCTFAVMVTMTFHDSTGVGGGIPKQDIRFKFVGSR